MFYFHCNREKKQNNIYKYGKIIISKMHKKRTLPVSCAMKNKREKTVAAVSPIKYVDLFCGLGAFHQAFNSSARFECVMACDIDEDIRKIYQANYGVEPLSDIREINTAAIPDFDLLCAGFPCQPFSIAGNGQGFKDTTKGNLFYEILRIIDTKSPNMCILENVKNLKTHDNQNTYKTIESELIKRGYIVTSEVLNATDFGSPQARQRIFIFATKNKSFTIPKPTQVNSNVVSTIIDQWFVGGDNLNLLKYTVKEKQVTTLFNPNKPRVLCDVFPILSSAKKQILDASKAKLKQLGGDPTTLDKGGRQGERVYSIDAVGITICASSGGPGAKTGLYKVGDCIRRLTVGETLKMFGFPDNYQFLDVTLEKSLFYLGNSIVVNVPLTFVPFIEDWFN